MQSDGSVRIGSHSLGSAHRPFVVAEMSANHNGSLDRAMQIVDAIAASGAQAIKLQSYIADTMTIDVDSPAFRVMDGHGLWGGRTLHDLYAEAHTPWGWHAPLFEHARSLGLLPFSSPFDPASIALLEGLDAEVYKTASAEIVDLPLIREIARTGKPIIMSTGMATLSEIEAALNTVRDQGRSDVILLACTASYPADPRDARLGNIGLLRSAFDVPVGYSDHSVGIGVSIAAVATGAVCIEKHVTLSRADGGVDSQFSMEPSELQQLVEEADRAWQATHSATHLGPVPAEQAVLKLRRSLYVVADVRSGDKVTSENVRSIRPSGGLPPDAITELIGRAFTRDVPRGTPFRWNLV